MRSTRTKSHERSDEGFSLVEILTAVTLIGLVVIGLLTAMSTTVMGSRLERDHAKAHQWLQSATQLVEAEEFGDCRDEFGVVPSAEDIRQTYLATVRSFATPPYGWTGGQIEIRPIDVWTGNEWIPYTTADACYDNVGFRMQRVTIEVSSPDGDIIESVEVVKSD